MTSVVSRWFLLVAVVSMLMDTVVPEAEEADKVDAGGHYVLKQCLEGELSTGVREWQTETRTSSVDVEWGYGNVSRLFVCVMACV